MFGSRTKSAFREALESKRALESQSRKDRENERLYQRLKDIDMKLTCKTLDNTNFEVEIGEEEGVEELMCLMEDKLGRENLYRLIYAGKMMHEGEMLSDYNMTGKLPVVVMVTKLEQFRRGEREADDGPKAKRVRTESEDSGFGEEEGDEHFVTEREFSIALEVVMTCQHFRRPSEVLSPQQMVAMVGDTFPEEEEVRQVILSRMDQVEEAGPTKEQFKAFILDIQSMYQEGREPEEETGAGSKSKSEEMLEEEEEDEDLPLKERNLRTMMGMGFDREDSERALARSSGSLQVALDLVLPRSSQTPPPMPDVVNPLAFLRDIPEFQFLRVLVMQKPALLEPLLIR